MQVFATIALDLRYIMTLILLRLDINLTILSRDDDGEDDDEFDSCPQASQAAQLNLEINSLLNTPIERQSQVPTDGLNLRRSSRRTIKNTN
jgi:hypothetical protein